MESIENLMLQDNKSLILLERNGKASSGKCTRHINICYFFISDQVNMKELTIEWCPTKQMVADFMTKPIQGSHFRHLRDYIMRRVCSSKPKMEAVCVERNQQQEEEGERQGPCQGGGTVNDIVAPQECVGVYS
jgi:hypothetical protein